MRSLAAKIFLPPCFQRLPSRQHAALLGSSGINDYRQAKDFGWLFGTGTSQGFGAIFREKFGEVLFSSRVIGNPSP